MWPFRANTSRFVLRSASCASHSGAALWWCEDMKPDVTPTPVGAEGACCHLDTVYQSKQTVLHRPQMNFSPESVCVWVCVNVFGLVIFR